MDTDEIKRNQEIIETLKRRKHQRELQLARLGVSADPVILIEIDDINRQLLELNKISIPDEQRLDIHTKRVELFNEISNHLRLVCSFTGRLLIQARRYDTTSTDMEIKRIYKEWSDVYDDFRSCYESNRVF